MNKHPFGIFRTSGVLLVVAIFIFCLTNITESKAANLKQGTTGFSQQTLTVAGQSRKVSFYAPASRNNQPPLVITFHGTSGNPEEWIDKSADSDPSGIEGLANQNGFVVAAPQSRFITISDWDHEYDGGDYYWEIAAPRGSNPNTNPDLLLVKQIISTAKTSFNIDPNRIYVMGFSNGGFFAVLTTMTLRDQIAAFAAVGSGLVKCPTTRSCKAQSTSTSCDTILGLCSCNGPEKPITIPSSGRKVPGFLGHNSRDDVVSAYYTCSLAKRMKELGYKIELMIGDEEGHGFPSECINRAWNFLSTKKLR